MAPTGQCKHCGITSDTPEPERLLNHSLNNLTTSCALHWEPKDLSAQHSPLDALRKVVSDNQILQDDFQRFASEEKDKLACAVLGLDPAKLQGLSARHQVRDKRKGQENRGIDIQTWACDKVIARVTRDREAIWPESLAERQDKDVEKDQASLSPEEAVNGPMPFQQPWAMQQHRDLPLNAQPRTPPSPINTGGQQNTSPLPSPSKTSIQSNHLLTSTSEVDGRAQASIGNPSQTMPQVSETETESNLMQAKIAALKSEQDSKLARIQQLHKDTKNLEAILKQNAAAGDENQRLQVQINEKKVILNYAEAVDENKGLQVEINQKKAILRGMFQDIDRVQANIVEKKKTAEGDILQLREEVNRMKEELLELSAEKDSTQASLEEARKHKAGLESVALAMVMDPVRAAAQKEQIEQIRTIQRQATADIQKEATNAMGLIARYWKDIVGLVERLVGETEGLKPVKEKQAVFHQKVNLLRAGITQHVKAFPGRIVGKVSSFQAGESVVKLEDECAEDVIQAVHGEVVVKSEEE